MPTEKRRYFRIDDTVNLSFRVLKPSAPELRLSTDIIDDSEMLEMVDAELDTLTNSLWDTDPKFARAIGLLNQKINLLAAHNRPSIEELMAEYDHQYPNIDVNISATGMAFHCDVKLDVAARLELLLFLKPSISGITLTGTVISTEMKDQGGQHSYYTCVEFDIEAKEKEQLVQHIVRKQVENIGQERQAV